MCISVYEIDLLLIFESDQIKYESNKRREYQGVYLHTHHGKQEILWDHDG